MITGLYPDEHGIVDNFMYDPDTEEYFNLFNASAQNPDWYGGQPMWETFQRYGGIR